MGALTTCKIDGCEKPCKAMGWCAMHYRRWSLTGDPGPAGTIRVAAEITACSVEDCDTPKRSSGAEYCEMHYYRVRRNGTLCGPQRYDNSICLVDGCTTPRKSNGMCNLHDTRVRRHGDPHFVMDMEDRDLPRAERSPMWTGENASYGAVHQRLRKVRGSARRYACVDCESRASQWSYDHAASNGQVDQASGLPYSTDLDHYDPRCVPCHKRHDLSRIKTLRGAV